MKINRISLTNFKSIRQYATEPLPDGIIGITGGNGQGKSTLLTAIAYAMYGPEALATGRADAVTWGEKKCEVEIAFESEEEAYTLVRMQDTKGDSKAFLFRGDSEVAKGPKAVNDEVERLVGIDLVGFQASVFSKQDDLLGLGALQTSKRVSTMLRLLGIDKIDDAIKYINAKGKEYRSELDTVRRILESYPTIDIQATVLEIERLKERKQELEVLLVQQHEEFEAAQKERATSSEAMERWADHQYKVDRVKAQLTTATEAYERALAMAASEPTAPTPPDKVIDLDAYARLTQECTRRVNQLHQAKDTLICPCCKRPFGELDLDHWNREQEEIEAIKLSIERDAKPAFETNAYEEALKDYNLRLVPAWKTAQKQVAANLKAKEALESAIRSLTTGFTGEDPTSEYTKATARFTEVSNAFAKSSHDLDVLNSTLDGYQREYDHYSLAAVARDENIALADALEKEVVAYATTSAELTTFKTSMVSGVIPALSESASDLIAQITEGKYSELLLTPQYDIQYRNDLGELKSFPNLSGGEQDAFALAMRLAIADLRAQRIGVLVLDEVFESLDPDRQESTWLALEKMSSRFSQVFLVTHVQAFKDRAPYTITL